MQIEKNTQVKLQSFLGTMYSHDAVDPKEDYRKLIGERGLVIDVEEKGDERVLVLFEKNLDDFMLANHNPIKNSLWIRTTDLLCD